MLGVCSQTLKQRNTNTRHVIQCLPAHQQSPTRCGTWPTHSSCASSLILPQFSLSVFYTAPPQTHKRTHLFLSMFSSQILCRFLLIFPTASFHWTSQHDFTATFSGGLSKFAAELCGVLFLLSFFFSLLLLLLLLLLDAACFNLSSNSLPEVAGKSSILPPPPA
jgi:hypothetical protein